jgi:hypothetical protein
VLRERLHEPARRLRRHTSTSRSPTVSRRRRNEPASSTCFHAGQRRHPLGERVRVRPRLGEPACGPPTATRWRGPSTRSARPSRRSPRGRESLPAFAPPRVGRVSGSSARRTACARAWAETVQFGQLHEFLGYLPLQQLVPRLSV